MIRIAYVINSIHPGGPSYVVRNIIKGLDRSMFDAILITLFDEDTDEIVKEIGSQNVPVFELKMPGRKYALTKGLRIFEELISKENINIIHSHGFIPDILSARAKNPKVGKLCTLHNNMFYDYAETYGNLKGKLFTFTHLHYLRKLDRCAACSQYVMDSMKKHLKNLVLVRNGIGKTPNIGNVTRKELGIPEAATIYIYTGQFRSRKNSIWMIECFKRYHKRNEYLILLGRGPDTEKCSAIKDDNIVFIGFSKDPYSYMRISDIYISAALAEGFSISVLEAMDNGLALFLSDIPAHNEVFQTAKGVLIGELFKSNDSQDFEKKISVLRNEIRTIDREEIRRIKNSKMSVENMTKQYEVLYTTL